MNKESRKELQWRIQNLKLCNGRLIIQHQSFVIIKTDASYVLIKIGGYREQETLGSSQGYMGLYNEEWDHDYSRIPANLPKCGGKLALKEPQGQFRVETSSPNISSNLPNKRDSRDRLVCISTVKSASKIFCLETGPIQSGPTQHPWGSKYLYAFPPFSMINKVLNKIKQVMLGNMVLVEPTWQSRTWYLILLSMSIEKPKLLPQYQHLLISTKTVAPTSNKQNRNISGVDSFREKLFTGGLSETTYQLISSMRRSGSKSNYNSSWAQWVSWCNEKKVDPFRCDINQVVNYLSFLFDAGLEYRTIGCHRSATSAYHEYIDGKLFGQHPKVCALLKGVYNKRSPQPRYVFIWDVQIVINYIKSEWRYSEGPSDRLLTLKLVMLMALTSASRASAIHHLDIRYMVKRNEKYVFKFHRLHKRWRCGKPIQVWN